MRNKTEFDKGLVVFFEFFLQAITKLGWKKVRNAIEKEMNVGYDSLEPVIKFHIYKVCEKYGVSVDELISLPLTKNNTKTARIMLTGLLLNYIRANEIASKVYKVSKGMVSRYHSQFKQLCKSNASFNRTYLELLK